MSDQSDLLVPTDRGLYCPEGDFHIDPWQPVERAIITHAHSDHARFGSATYLCAERGQGILRARIGDQAAITGLPFAQPTTIGSVKVSFHPAGHVLGSAQVRVGRPTGETWVVSGDYKTIADRTCDPFEPVRCHTFITESTFGLPIYRWQPQHLILGDINAWWRSNAAIGRTSIVFAYALGKAQRVLAGIDPSIGPIGVHGALLRMNEAYRAAGIALPPIEHAAGDAIPHLRGRGLIVAPPSSLGSPWIRKFAATDAGMSAAFVSGWMRVRGTRRRRAIDRGFILSDHADWDGLLWAIRETGATRIGVTHGYVGPLVRWLRESGLDSFPVPTHYTGEIGEAAEETEPPRSRGGASDVDEPTTPNPGGEA